MIQECKNSIVDDDFHEFLHRNCTGTGQLQRVGDVMGGKVLKLQSEILREEGFMEGRTEGRAEGRAEGRTEGRENTIFELVQDGDYSVQRGAEKLGLSVSEFEKRMEAAGYKLPMMV